VRLTLKEKRLSRLEPVRQIREDLYPDLSVETVGSQYPGYNGLREPGARTVFCRTVFWRFSNTGQMLQGKEGLHLPSEE